MATKLISDTGIAIILIIHAVCLPENLKRQHNILLGVSDAIVKVIHCMNQNNFPKFPMLS